ncbi:MAG: hypothetical protein RLZZ198_1514 [Bacteroidota bacterium]|jgi:glycosyltransferase involved in cell wall biosynthesis
MSKTRIFFFFPLASVGGTERVHLDVLNALSNYPLEIFIRYRVNPWKGMAHRRTKEAKREGVQWLSLFKAFGSVTFLSTFLEAPRFGRLIRRLYIKRLASKINSASNPVVVFWHRESIEFLLPFIESHVKLVDIVHNNSNNSVADPCYLNNDLALRIDRRVLVNIGLLNWINLLYSNAGYPSELLERIKVINHKVNFPSSIPNKPTTDFNVIFVGREAKEKRVDLFLEIASCCADLAAIKFHVVGIKSEFSSQSNITWHGVVLDQAHIESLYSQSHALVMTSESEGFPKVIAESMAFGCVPIVTAVGGIPSVLQDGDCAILTNPDQCVEESIAHIVTLSQHPLDFNERSKKAYFYAKEHFDSERFDNEWKKLIQSLG